MSDTVERLRGAARWSMASRCPRQAAYGLIGVDPTPPTARESGRMARGRDAGHYFARQMAAKHGEENVIAEMAIPWPAGPGRLPVGELHIDVGLLSERIACEAKNSVWVDSMFDSAVLQLAGALHWGSEHFDSGLLVFLDHDYQITHEFPVFLTDELVEQVESIAESVIAAGVSGAIPERVCGKPADGRGHFCPFIEHCFGDDWEPEQTEERTDLSEFASRGWLIQRDLKAARGNVDELQDAWDAWKAEAEEFDLPPGAPVNAGPVTIKRIEVKGRETFSKAKAKTAGVWTNLDDERFGPFVKIGESGVRFDLSRTEGSSDLDLGLDDSEAPF